MKTFVLFIMIATLVGLIGAMGNTPNFWFGWLTGCMMVFAASLYGRIFK